MGNDLHAITLIICVAVGCDHHKIKVDGMAIMDFLLTRASGEMAGCKWKDHRVLSDHFSLSTHIDAAAKERRGGSIGPFPIQG